MSLSIVNVMLGRMAGGLERMAAQYHAALTDMGHEVITLGHPDAWIRTQLPNGARFSPMRATRIRPVDRWRVATHLRAVKANVVIAHGRLAVACIPKGWIAGRNPAVRIGVMHNFRFDENLRNMDAWFAVSPGVASALRLVPAGHCVETVENFTDLLDASGRPPWADTPRIGAIGRLHANKGFDLLLRALARPEVASRPWTLVIAGEGPERAPLQALARDLGLEQRTRFIGWVDDRRAFYSAVDLVCIPSRQEPFGLVLVEALAHRLPVVASAASGFVDIATDGMHAMLAPVDDVAGFARRITSLLDDPEAATALGRRGQEMVERRFLYPAFRQRLDDAILTATARRRPAGAFLHADDGLTA